MGLWGSDSRTRRLCMSDRAMLTTHTHVHTLTHTDHCQQGRWARGGESCWVGWVWTQHIVKSYAAFCCWMRAHHTVYTSVHARTLSHTHTHIHTKIERAHQHVCTLINKAAVITVKLAVLLLFSWEYSGLWTEDKQMNLWGGSSSRSNSNKVPARDQLVRRFQQENS